VLDYLIFLGSFAASIVIILIFKRILVKRLTKWAKKTPTSLDDMIIKAVKKYLLPLLYIGALYFNTYWLTLSKRVASAIDIFALALVMILGAAVISAVFIYLFNKALEKRQKKVDTLAVRLIGVVIKAAIWVCALLLFLGNIGADITPLIAGLGIGGIAVAFALQAILQDLFSFVTIFFDRPFELGDFIIVDDLMGTVEHIGIKTTRVRSLSGEQLIFSNKDLTNSRVRNYKRMENRRIVFSLGVTYSTPQDKLKEIPGLIKSIIEGIENTRFDRAHFKEFGDSSLAFETAYYILSQNYNLYMDIQQAINFAIKEEFDKRGIEFAFPTQTLYIEK
jgi:small-conductance mechanosensitive channel